jgi:purine-binding chemotaxis protein CheW
MKESSVRFDKSKSTAIDWSQIHARLDFERQITDRGSNASPGEKKRLLRERAKALARVPERLDMAGERIDVVEFRLADERYAFEPRFIREICPLKELTPLPCTPPFVLGIVNLRGQILSVIDLGRFFGLPAKSITELNRVIILKSGDMEFGIRTDEILGMKAIPRRDIQPPPFQTGIPTHFIMGMAPDGLIVLNGEKILADRGIVVEEEGRS